MLCYMQGDCVALYWYLSMKRLVAGVEHEATASVPLEELICCAVLCCAVIPVQGMLRIV